MEVQSENFIRIISSYIKGGIAQIENADWKKITSLAVDNNLSAIVYHYIKDKNICDDADVLNRLKKAFLGTLKFSAIQEIITKQLIGILNQNNIRHIVFKGYVLRNYYPHKEFRTMGDIDIIIDENNQNKVHKLLLSFGFAFDEMDSKKTVRNYVKNNICFEIHTKLVSKNLFEDIDYTDYFKDCFSHCENVENHTFELNREYHFIYLIVHMAKHFKNGGCGVRMILDIAVFADKLKDKLDWDYIREQLEYLKLYDFSKVIFLLCEKWFGTDIPLDKTQLNKDEICVIEEYILAGGIFGDVNKNLDAIRIGSSGNSLTLRFINLLKIIFPSYKNMTKRYVWFEGTSKWLLPLGWIKLWRLRVSTGENSFKRIGQALKSNDDAKKHKELINKIGLKQ